MRTRNLVVKYCIVSLFLIVISLLFFKFVPFWYFFVSMFTFVFSFKFTNDFLAYATSRKMIRCRSKKRYIRMRKKMTFSFFLFLLSIIVYFIPFKMKNFLSLGLFYFSLLTLILAYKECKK